MSDVMVQFNAMSGLTGPRATHPPTASAFIQLDFDLAAATDVRLFLDNTPTYFGPGPSTSTSLVHWVGNGAKESIALPETLKTSPQSMRYSGEAFVTLAAGHYSMLSQVSPAADYTGSSAMGATDRFTITAVPEAGTLVTTALGLAGVFAAARRRKQAGMAHA